MSRRKAITKSSSKSSSQAFSYSLYTSNLNRASGTVYSRPSTQQILRFLNQDIYYKALVSRILSLSVVLDVSTVCLIIPAILAQSVITITSYADISIIQRTIFIVYTTQATSSSIGQYRCLVGISIFKRNRISSTIFRRGIVVIARLPLRQYTTTPNPLAFDTSGRIYRRRFLSQYTSIIGFTNTSQTTRNNSIRSGISSILAVLVQCFRVYPNLGTSLSLSVL